MNIDDQIQNIIKNELPTQVGLALQERLAQAEKDSKDLAECKKYTEELLESMKDLREGLDTQETNKKRLKEAKDLEEKMAVTLAMKDKVAAEDKCTMMKNLVSQVFGHPNVTITKSGFRDVPVPADSSGYTPQPQSLNHDDTETRVEGKE